jgi:hypothetical protein
MDTSTLELQRAIVAKHLANDFPLLKKRASATAGTAGINPLTFSASYNLTGRNSDQHSFLPNFEYSLGTSYWLDVPGDLIGGTIYHERDKIRTFLKGGTSQNIEIAFRHLTDLFQLRNLALEGRLSSILAVDDKYRAMLPIEESQINTNYHFHATCATRTELVGIMDIDRPGAEEVIQKWLETVDRRFDDYRGLEPHFQEKDASGRDLDEIVGLQPRKYNKERNKLHKATFTELADVMKQADLKYRLRK